MEIVLALLAAFFAGITTVLCKIGMSKTSANIATLLRTIFVMLFSLIVILIMGTFKDLSAFTTNNYVFLGLSSISTATSWIFYYHAIKAGEVNKVAVLDKFSVVLTMILAIVFLNEKANFYTYSAMVLIFVGTVFMLYQKKDTTEKTDDIEVSKKKTIQKKQYLFALLSCVFASLNNIFAKIGLKGIDSTLATLFRTIVVILALLIIMFFRHEYKQFKKLDKKNVLFILLSGLTTSLSWLLYNKALQLGSVTVIVPIDKLSIVVMVLCSMFFLKERINKWGFLGLFFIVLGTLLVIL